MTGRRYLHFLIALIVPIPFAKSTYVPALSPNPGVSTNHTYSDASIVYLGNIANGYLVIDFCYGLVCNCLSF
jgi:hypothetical protein